jgi:hypothetical protein
MSQAVIAQREYTFHGFEDALSKVLLAVEDAFGDGEHPALQVRAHLTPDGA